MNWGSMAGSVSSMHGAWWNPFSWGDDILEALSVALYSVWAAFWEVIYYLWYGFAWVIDTVEEVFLQLAGVKKIANAQELSSGEGGGLTTNQAGGNDIATWLINQPVVRQVFNNVVIVSVVLLIFFTIFQIIREQYRDKEGGNPYMIVFRMFKGIVTFAFVTVAVFGGLFLSGIVLNALNQATANSSNATISGQIFGAMSYNGNRLRQTSADIAGMMGAARKQYKMNLAKKTREGEFYTIHEKTSKPTITHDVRYKPYLTSDEITDTVDGEYWGYLGRHDIVGADYIVKRVKFKYHDAAGAPYPSSIGPDGLYYSTKNEEIVTVEGGGNTKKIYPATATSSGGFEFIAQGFSTQPDVGYASESEAASAWKQMIMGVSNYAATIDSFHREVRRFRLTKEQIIENKDNPSSMIYNVIPAFLSNGEEYIQEFTVEYPVLINRSNKTNEEYFNYLLDTSRNYTVFSARANNLFKSDGFYELTKGGTLFADFVKGEWASGTESATEAFYNPTGADNLDTYMKQQIPDDQTQINWVVYHDDDGKVHGVLGALSYQSWRVVAHLYDVPFFDMIIGFGAIWLVFGIYTSFAFALIQRLMEMVIMYMLSPITLSLYPIDDGNSFGSQFVKPFYGKVISVYAVILSLNLFFLIYPLFTRIKFFPTTGEGSGVMSDLKNMFMSTFMMCALVAMLPKMRSTINSMFAGSESLEGKGMLDTFKEGLTAMGGATLAKGAKFAYKTNKQRVERGGKPFLFGKGGGKIGAGASWLSRKTGLSKLARGVDGLTGNRISGTIAGAAGLIGKRAQDVKNNKLFQAMFDKDNGTLMQGKFGEFVRDHSAMERRAHQRKYLEDVEKRTQSDAEIEKEGRHAAHKVVTSKADIDKFINTHKDKLSEGQLATMLSEGNEDKKNGVIADVEKNMKEQAFVQMVNEGIISEHSHDDFMNGLDMKGHILGNGADYEANKLKFEEHSANAEIEQFKGDKRLYEESTQNLKDGLGDLGMTSVDDPRLKNILATGLALKGDASVEGSFAQKMNAIMTGKNADGTNNEFAGMSESQKTVKMAEVRKKMTEDFMENVYGLDLESIGVADIRKKHRQRVMGYHAAAESEEIIKDMTKVVEHIPTKPRNAIFSHQEVGRLMGEGQFGQLAMELEKVASGKGEESIFKDNKEIMKMMQTEDGRYSARALSSMFTNMIGSPEGLLSGKLASAADASALALQVAFTDMMIDYNKQFVSYLDGVETNAKNTIDASLGKLRVVAGDFKGALKPAEFKQLETILAGTSDDYSTENANFMNSIIGKMRAFGSKSENNIDVQTLATLTNSMGEMMNAMKQRETEVDVQQNSARMNIAKLEKVYSKYRENWTRDSK